MAKGTYAKELVKDKIITAFGADFIGEVGGKLYVEANDGAFGCSQICIAMTCPKTPIEKVDADPPAKKPANGAVLDFAYMDKVASGQPFDDSPPWVTEPVVDITEKEKENIDKLKRVFNIF